MGRETHLALAKVLAAAAWADGRVEVDEVNVVKAFMLRVRLGADDTAEVMHLLDDPVTRTEAEELTRAFLASVSSDTEKRLLYDELYELFAADGEVSEDEERFLRTVKEALETHTVVDMLLDRVRSVFSWSRGKRESASLADVLRSRLQTRVRESLASLASETDRDAARLNRATLFGAILQKVAVADGAVDAPERARIIQLLGDRFGFGTEELATIEAVLAEQVTGDVDERRLAAEFNRVSDGGERRQLLWAMFHVATADGRLDASEVDGIRRIADFLWIDRRTFNDVRLEAESTG